MYSINFERGKKGFLLYSAIAILSNNIFCFKFSDTKIKRSFLILESIRVIKAFTTSSKETTGVLPRV